MTRAVIAGIYLGICALTDIRTRRISVLLSIVAALVGASLAIYSRRAPQEVLLGVLPGLLMMALSWLTRGAVGIGDGIVITVAGLFLEPGQLLGAWLAGSFLRQSRRAFFLSAQGKERMRSHMCRFCSRGILRRCWPGEDKGGQICQ